MSDNNIFFFENDSNKALEAVYGGSPVIVAECDELLERYETEEYRSFVSCITDKVSQAAGKGYTVSGRRVLKNNSVSYDSISILRDGQCVSPSFYVNDYYDDYLRGVPSDVIADGIMNRYHECMKNVDCSGVEDYSFEHMKSRIVFKLINYDRNRELLETTPHIRYLDLAVIFCCLVKVDNHGMGTIRITSDHCRSWGVGVEELKRCAAENAPFIMPHTCRNIFSVLAEIMLDEKMMSQTGNVDREALKEVIDCLESDQPARKGNSMYVLTTMNRINGAACLLYEGVLEEIREKLGCGFYILPSSVNEVLIVPDTVDGERSFFENVVPEVNREQVPVSEILSDRVYHYPEDDFRI